jgi:urease accessory protein
MNRKTLPLIVFAALSLVALRTSAHPSHGDAASSALTGFLHPFTGWDHLLATFAVGLWAAQLGGRARWMVPVAFVFAMTLGGLGGAASFRLPLAEAGILASLFAIGLFVTAAVRMPLRYACSLVAMFAFAHGHAHGAEMPTHASLVTYAAGFLAATTLLHMAGVAFAILIAGDRAPAIPRVCGAVVTLAAFVLWTI